MRLNIKSILWVTILTTSVCVAFVRAENDAESDDAKIDAQAQKGLLNYFCSFLWLFTLSENGVIDIAQFYWNFRKLLL